jgi:salicylate biosynthesis isochorismate synthase/menaquinone-specific isochorismate synthase
LPSPAVATERLHEAVSEAAGRQRPTLASVTVEVDLADPCAAVFASRLATDRWFCWEQPDRGFALAGLGAAAEVVGRGEERFAKVAADCLDRVAEPVLDAPTGLPAGAGPVWLGGFAFDPDGGRCASWTSLDPASMVLPELSVCRSGGATFLTLNALVQPGRGETVEAQVAAMQRRLASLRDQAPLPLLDPHPAAQPRIHSSRTPTEFEDSIDAATARIGAGEMDKVVLAREVIVSAGSAHDPAAIFGALRQQFPSCFCFCCGTPEAAFLGASPELLVRRNGASVSTVALAGSTRRSSDPSVDDHLAERLLRSEKDRLEHRIVAERIVRTLRPHAVWVQAGAEPEIVKVANIQHLATPVVAQLAEPHSAIELAGVLHPTPAVGGEPRAAALAAIADLERMDRGRYAGPVGWMDAAEDGEFCVALRSALLRDREAHLFAGVGVVAGSDPAAELTETEIKLEALLPLVS